MKLIVVFISLIGLLFFTGCSHSEHDDYISETGCLKMGKKYIQSKGISYKRSSNQAPGSTQSLVNGLYFNEREHTCILDYRRYKSPIETYEYIYEGQDRRVIVDVINNEEIANANADGNSESNLEYNIIYEKINNDHNYKKIDLPDLQK